MTHLGRWISAQVDGELAGIERDRVLNHIAGCEACREEANSLRALKRRMTELGGSTDEESIAGRLIELGRSDQDFAAQVFGDSDFGDANFGAPPFGRLPWPAQFAQIDSWPKHPKLGWRLATGSAGTVLLTLGVLAFMLGGSQPEQPAPRVTPAMDAYWKQHANDAGQEPTDGIGTSRSSANRPGPGRLLLPATQGRPNSRSPHPSSP